MQHLDGELAGEQDIKDYKLFARFWQYSWAFACPLLENNSALAGPPGLTYSGGKVYNCLFNRPAETD
jgi:hypothetical protein